MVSEAEAMGIVGIVDKGEEERRWSMRRSKAGRGNRDSGVMVAVGDNSAAGPLFFVEGVDDLMTVCPAMI